MTQTRQQNYLSGLLTANTANSIQQHNADRRVLLILHKNIIKPQFSYNISATCSKELHSPTIQYFTSLETKSKFKRIKEEISPYYDVGRSKCNHIV